MFKQLSGVQECQTTTCAGRNDSGRDGKLRVPGKKGVAHQTSNGSLHG